MEDSHSQGIAKEKRTDFGRTKRLRTQSEELHEAADLDSGRNNERKAKCIEQEETIKYSRHTDGVSSNTGICTDRQIVVEDNSCCAEGHDKLEKYLEDIYERECNFHIDKSEEVFIQNAVEQYVYQYMDQYKNLACPDTCDISHCQPELLKVGSFYEETKNKFPNEFDFIIVIGTAEELPTTLHQDHIQNAGKANYRYTSEKDTAVFVEFVDFLGQHGPAEKVSLCYNKGSGKEMITIDIAMGVRVLYTEEIHKTKSIIKDDEVFHCPFLAEILKTGSFLLVDYGTIRGNDQSKEISGPWVVSVTETEVAFMKNVLSLAHKKVYRLLKYLINGNFGDKLLKCTSFSLSISSYNLKTAIAHHHYQCTGNSPAVASCVLNVLNVIYCKITEGKVANFSYFPNHETTEVFPDSLTTFQLTRKLSRLPFPFDKILSRPSRDFTLYRTIIHAEYNGSQSKLLSASNECTDIIAAIFRAFMKRLITLKESKAFEKCSHMVNDSFLEMLLMVPAISFAAHYNLLSGKHLWFYDDHDRHVFESFKAAKTQNCPWCNFK